MPERFELQLLQRWYHANSAQFSFSTERAARSGSHHEQAVVTMHWFTSEWLLLWFLNRTGWINWTFALLVRQHHQCPHNRKVCVYVSVCYQGRTFSSLRHCFWLQFSLGGKILRQKKQIAFLVADRIIHFGVDGINKPRRLSIVTCKNINIVYITACTRHWHAQSFNRCFIIMYVCERDSPLWLWVGPIQRFCLLSETKNNSKLTVTSESTGYVQ